MKQLLYVFLGLLLLAGCKDKRYFKEIPGGENWLCQIAFDDDSKKEFWVMSDVLYAGEDSTSRYKMVFYMPDGWDDSYPVFLDRYVPRPDMLAGYTAYQGMPVAEQALKMGNMIVVLVAYDEKTAIPDILLAEHFLKEHDDDIPGDSKNILTAADFDFK
ncbi:MAG: hypothetical protein IJV01_03245 [Bacteroidales bacterium]|nr:hypothetical protein [Bacteroidales bacterium]